jgi:hypothetical protein
MAELEGAKFSNSTIRHSAFRAIPTPTIREQLQGSGFLALYALFQAFGKGSLDKPAAA